MERLNKAIRINAIILNAVFLAGIILFLIKLGADPRNLRDWAGFISMFAFPPITLIAITLTFQKKLQILTLVLKIIAIILNASFLLILIWVTALGNVHLDGIVMWLFGLLGYGLPVLNLTVIALTFRRAK
ncbi:MAG: hypothetical protein ACYS67_17410 [Planctomycetota bacterium]|jgi:hypothetical protein